MAKPVRITLIIVVSVVLLGGIMALVSTIGMNDIKEYKVPDINMSAIADGEYQGACTVSRWATTLKVTVKDHKITAIEITKKMTSSVSPDFTDTLFKRIIEKQSLYIDAVSGASLTTKGFLIAVADALKGTIK